MSPHFLYFVSRQQAALINILSWVYGLSNHLPQGMANYYFHNNQASVKLVLYGEPLGLYYLNLHPVSKKKFPIIQWKFGILQWIDILLTVCYQLVLLLLKLQVQPLYINNAINYPQYPWNISLMLENLHCLHMPWLKLLVYSWCRKWLDYPDSCYNFHIYLFR